MLTGKTSSGVVLFLAQSGTAPAASRANQVWVLLGIVGVVLLALVGLLVLLAVRRLALRDVTKPPAKVAKPSRPQRSAWVEAGRRAKPLPAIDVDASDLDDEPDDEERS